MKRSIILFSIILMTFNLFAQARLLNYNVSSYGDIARVRLELNQKASISIYKDPQNQKILISLFNTQNANGKAKVYNNPVVSNINVNSSGGQLNIIINTSKSFAEVRESYQSGTNYTIIFDIFNNSNPSTVKDYLSYVNYYK